MRCIPFICSLLLIAGATVGQNVTVVNLKKGLSNNYVECMVQDSQGIIWIGTRDGLNRYDGHHVTVYKDELPSSFIYSLLEVNAREIWIGLSQGGISIYDPMLEKFTTLGANRKFSILANKDVYELYEDRHHNIWIGTLQGLAQIPAARDTIYWYEENLGEIAVAFMTILEKENGQILLGTNNGLYQVISSKQQLQIERCPIEHLAKNIFIRDLAIDHHNNLWLATDTHGIISITHDRQVRTYITTPQKDGHLQVWKLFLDTQDNLWAGVINGGIFQFDRRREKFISHAHEVSSVFNSKSITGIQRDREGNLWVSSHGDGVCYFNPEKYVFEKYLSGEAEGGSKPKIVASFFEDQEGTLWIGTDGNGLMKTSGDGKVVPAFSTSNGLSSDIILDIIEDEANHKWLATWQGGVNRITTNNRVKTFNIDPANPFALRNDNIKSLLVDSSQNLWMVSHGNGVSMFNIPSNQFVDPSGVTKSYRTDVAQWGSDILQTKKGDIWIASHAGLYHYTKDAVFHYAVGTIGSALVYCLFEDADENIWIGTSSSLERFDHDTNSFENYSRLYGIPGNIKCILQDNERHLWFSTVHELIEFDPDTKHVKRYDESFNAQTGQYYECSCLKSKNGKMYFGGTEGFNAFWPDSIDRSTITPKLHISNIYLFNKRQVPNIEGSVLTQAMPFTRTLNLSYDQNFISFEFLAIAYGAHNDIRYSYRMENLDAAWSPASENVLATYTNLDHGEYIFRVRALSSNGNVLAEKKVEVNVIPPFWLTLWFKVISIVMAIGLTVGYLLYRLYSSKQKRLHLQQLVAERTKEVHEKNILLEEQTRDLAETNKSILEQGNLIREQTKIVEDQRDQLQKNNDQLQEAISTKDRLFSIIAHDLRNPFTSLLGVTKLLNSDYSRYSEEEKLKLIRKLYHSSASIYSLLDNLLVWSKSQQNELLFETEVIQFTNFIADHFDLIGADAEKKGVRLQLGSTDDVRFEADRNMLSVIIRNLLSNALRFAPINGMVVVAYKIVGQGLEISVKDDGPGIQDPSTLFYLHTQKQIDHGHGLGLILCREFVEKHSGSISAKNNPDRGSCFVFTLPNSKPIVLDREIILEAAYAKFKTESNPSEVAEGKPVVLIAEDDDDIRWYIRQMLFPDFQVLEAINGQDGMTLAIEKMPDLIISDMNMPAVTGLDFCEQVKRHLQTSHIPFLMLTAERGAEKKVTGFEAGIDDYITKPIEPVVLRARINNVLDTRRKLKSIYQRDITTDPENYTTNNVDQEFLNKLNRIIISRITDSDFNPDALARDMHMSRTGLYMKVKALTGESVAIYIRNLRLKESRQLLRAGTMNVSEVAYAVGFNQLPYFTACFKEAFGITPSDYMTAD